MDKLNIIKQKKSGHENFGQSGRNWTKNPKRIRTNGQNEQKSGQKISENPNKIGKNGQIEQNPTITK